MAETQGKTHAVSFTVFILIWLCLLVLTSITVYVSGLDIGAVSTFTAIFIASVKALLVLLFFMHLKYEPPLFVITSLVALLTLTVIFLMTFSDVWFR